MSNKRNKMFNLEFLQMSKTSWKPCAFSPGHSSYGLEVNTALYSSWAHPWALSWLLGPVTSLGSSLNARHSPWASGQLGKAPGPWPGWYKLGKAGEGWTRPLGLNRPGMAGTTLCHTQNTPWQELCWLTPESVVLTFWALHLFLNIWQFWQFWQPLAPHWPPKCHRASWGSAVW